MNIWYFHHYATPYEIPGLHRPFEFGSYMSKNKYKVTVFTSSYLHYSGDNMIQGEQKRIEKEYDDVKTVFVKTSGYKNSKIDRIVNMMQFGKRLKDSAVWYSEKYGIPDAIIASSPHPLTMLAGIATAKKFHVPCICEVRDFWPEVFFLGGIVKEKSFIGKMLLRGERYIYEKADKLVFLKEGDHTYITDHRWDRLNGGKIDMEKCFYVNNGVDIKLFDEKSKNECPKNMRADPSKFNVCYCGTIRPINNIGLILDVAKKFDDNVQFLIYGSGNCEEELKRRAMQENIKNVQFKGYIDNKYVPAVLKNSSVALLNYSESGYNWSRGNSSNKLFEYLASGKPVVSTVKMGYDILKKYDCGISAESCTAEGVSEAIKYIYNLSESEYSKMCKNARTAAEKFDIPVLSEKYINVIERAVSDYKQKS